MGSLVLRPLDSRSKQIPLVLGVDAARASGLSPAQARINMKSALPPNLQSAVEQRVRSATASYPSLHHRGIMPRGEEAPMPRLHLREMGQISSPKKQRNVRPRIAY